VTCQARKVAALYVEKGGCYFDLENVDPWDEARDAKSYDGPHPVVAHPPCQRWGKYWAGSPLVINRTGKRLVKGDDAGCFAAALASVRRWGGIIEHPASSYAWKHFGLNAPMRVGWTMADWEGGWTCHVEQGQYGHWARKETWLYACHVELPQLDWGKGVTKLDPEIVARIGFKKASKLGTVSRRGGGGNDKERSATPVAFRDLLLSIARTATPTNETAP
jgi:hypothetical protein